MTPDRWQVVKQLLAEALELGPAEQPRFIERVCGGDTELRYELESLLDAAGTAPRFFARPLLEEYPEAFTEAAATRSDADLRRLHEELAGQAASFPGRFPRGTVLDSRYRLVRFLGGGGGGEVYRADDLRLRQPVALKFLAQEHEHSVQRREQLLAEASLARRITHPNVCRVYDVGEIGCAIFVSMEFLEGVSLEEFVQGEADRLAPDRALAVTRALAEGLDAIHREGVLHRDLKPANVMLDGRGRPRITDFGIAAALGETLGNGAGAPNVGTPAYMAPELFAGQAASVASDLYALGLVLHELWSGRRAVTADSVEELVRWHREAAPPSLGADLPAAVEAVLTSCLAKDPRHRPGSAAEVARRLDASTGGVHAVRSGRAPRVRRWPAPEWPERPYPLLLPITHPALFGGRRPELAEFRRRLAMPVPILGLYAASGAGKSSLLLAGLAPALRADGVPTAVDRHPHEPGLARRLLGDLVDLDDGISDDVGDPRSFADLLLNLEHRAGHAPVLVLDQFEDVLRPSSRPGRLALGQLLAATTERVPKARFVLAYRQEAHGDVAAWLEDVTGGESMDFGDPRDLSGPERFHAVPLLPLGTAPPGADERTAAVQAFYEAIVEPLEIRDADGEARYPWRFAASAAQRLAEAFADERLRRADAPLTPELQVVLARLLDGAGERSAGGDATVPIVVAVPEDPAPLLAAALVAHLRRVLDAAFPPDRQGARISRARALLVLRELAEGAGHAGSGREGEVLARIAGGGGEDLLERLAAPDARLILKRPEHGIERFVLAHDRLAEAIVRLVDGEGAHLALLADRELLTLRRIVQLNVELHHSGDPQATRLSWAQHRGIRRYRDTLLWDADAHDWWRDCRRAQRRTRRQFLGRAASALTLLALVLVLAWWWSARRALLDRIVQGEPDVALTALVEATTAGIDADTLRDRLYRRSTPYDVLEKGLAGVDPARRAATVLDVAELLMPRIEVSALADAVRVSGTPEDAAVARLAAVSWALATWPGRHPALSERTAELNAMTLAPLLEQRPRPPPENAPWAEISAGGFDMGTDFTPGTDDDSAREREHPRHRVEVSAFRMLVHEVTNAELRHLFPAHRGDDDRPALVPWYVAWAYAAWLGGRLPTEAEWEYAARAARNHEPAVLAAEAWYGHEDAEGPLPVATLEPNPWGLYDMLGNAWEWTADWYGPFSSEARVDPVGPPGGEGRVIKGGDYYMPANRSRYGYRVGIPTDASFGFRVVLPTRPIAQ